MAEEICNTRRYPKRSYADLEKEMSTIEKEIANEEKRWVFNGLSVTFSAAS